MTAVTAQHLQQHGLFWIHLADGGRLPVEHEDFVALEPAGREFIVYPRKNTHHVVDVMMVTRLEVKSRNGVHTKKKS